MVAICVLLPLNKVCRQWHTQTDRHRKYKLNRLRGWLTEKLLKSIKKSTSTKHWDKLSGAPTAAAVFMKKKYSIIAVFCVSSSKNYFKTQGLLIINLHVLRITKIFGIPIFWADEINLFFIMISIYLCLNILLWYNCFF